MSRSSFTGGLEICHFTLSPTFGKTLQHEYWEFKSRDENSLSPDEIYRSMTLVSRMSKFRTFNTHEALPSTEEKVLQHKHRTVKASSRSTCLQALGGRKRVFPFFQDLPLVDFSSHHD